MRRLSSLFSRLAAARSTDSAGRSGLDGSAAVVKPRPKRCLNEGGHKLYR